MPREPEDDGFLTRWSRRKREVEAEQKAVLATEEAPAADLPVEAESAEAAPEPGPEMVEPPSLETVDQDFDLAHWLKQNVPESWKLAALRRVWETDPAIRDFLNPAREYALDWNTPGGAPGYGPLGESDDVKAMLAQLFPEPVTPPDPAIDDTQIAEKTGDKPIQLSSNHDDGEGLALDHAAMQQRQASGFAAEKPIVGVLAQNPAVRRSDGQSGVEIGNIPNAATHKSIEAVPSDTDRPLPSRRRGGGAMPV